jgi:RNA polymerase primary sigma factor
MQNATAASRTTTVRPKQISRAAPASAFDQYLHDIQKLPLIKDSAEEKRLARLAQRGDTAAADQLVTCNLRFVISFVKKYQGHGLDLSELVAIGNEGLLKAVRKFDPDQGVKFISYAVWWVRQAVLKALAEQTRSVRIPLNQNSQLIRLAKAETILSQVLKRDPTVDELARVLDEGVAAGWQAGLWACAHHQHCRAVGSLDLHPVPQSKPLSRAPDLVARPNKSINLALI